MLLETEHLILRHFREEDFADFCAFAIDPEACRLLGRDNIHDEGSARPTFDWLMNREERAYALVLKETGRVIGNLTVGAVPPELARREELRGKTGWSLSFSLSGHYRRRGLMFEALTAVIGRLFRTEGADYVHCGYFDFNIPSRELQKKLGFTYLITVQLGKGLTGIENILWRE